MVLLFFILVMVQTAILAVYLRPKKREQALDGRMQQVVQSEHLLAAELPLVPSHLEVERPGRFKALDSVLGGFWFARRVQLLIVQGQSSTSVGAVVVNMAACLCATLVAVYVCTQNLVLASIAAIPMAFAPIGLLLFRKRRRVTAFTLALPDAIDLCARSLRVGHSLTAALSILADESAEPCRTEFAEVFKKQNYGLPLRDALLQMLDRVPSADLQVFVTGILVQKDTGGNLAEILDRIVQVIRERLRIHRDIRVHTAQGRLTGWILCLLPVVMLGLINIMNPGYSKVLFDEPIGRKMLYAGVGLLMLGGFLIRRIVNGIEV